MVLWRYKAAACSTCLKFYMNPKIGLPGGAVILTKGSGLYYNSMIHDRKH